MFSKSLVGGALALVLSACSGAGPTTESQQGQVSQTASTQAAEPEHGARFLERFDKNGDGKVEVSELPEHLAQKIGAADTNKDGVISTEEMQAFRQARSITRFQKDDKNSDGALEQNEVSPERWARIQVADANHDGKVTRDELAAARKSGLIKKPEHRHHGRGGHAGHAGGMGSPEQMIGRMDANKDGKLQRSEVDSRMQRWFDRVDANHDGVVTKEEIAAARAARAAGASTPAPTAPQTETKGSTSL